MCKYVERERDACTHVCVYTTPKQAKPGNSGNQKSYTGCLIEPLGLLFARAPIRKRPWPAAPPPNSCGKEPHARRADRTFVEGTGLEDAVSSAGAWKAYGVEHSALDPMPYSIIDPGSLVAAWLLLAVWASSFGLQVVDFAQSKRNSECAEGLQSSRV